MEDIAVRLAAIVGSEQVLCGEDMAPYLRDWRGRYQGAARCVVRPGHREEVIAVVQCCAEAGIPMVPQGGNTGLCGGATPDTRGTAVLISLSRLNRIRALDPVNFSITAEAGCVLAQVQKAALTAGCIFPLALASQGSAQLGGNIATNAGGVQVLRYGNTRALTLGLEVVLPSGVLWQGLHALRKNNMGYDLKHLFIGSEGTLGIITAASMQLFPRPQSVVTAWLGLSSPLAALSFLQSAQAAFGSLLTALELISEAALTLVLKHFPDTARPVSVCPWYILLECSSVEAADGLRERVETFLAASLEKSGRPVIDGVIAQNDSQAQRLWALREHISEGQKRQGLSVKHDIALPLSKVADFLTQTEHALIARLPEAQTVVFGHLGDGNLHYNVFLPAYVDEDSAQMQKVAVVNDIVYEHVQALGGSISAEHGIGQLRCAVLQRYTSKANLDLMRGVKQLLDPDGLMNPGKILPEA